MHHWVLWPLKDIFNSFDKPNFNVHVLHVSVLNMMTFSCIYAGKIVTFLCSKESTSEYFLNIY